MRNHSKITDKPCLLVGFTSYHDITGLALAFDLLLAGFEQRKIPYRLVDFGKVGLAARPGTFDIPRILVTLKMLCLFCWQAIGVHSVYILIASSTLGFLRDAFMIWVSHLMGHRLVLHLNGGGYRPFYESQPPWLQRYIAHTISRADAIIVLGEQLRDQFTFVTNYEEKICIIPNGLPLDLSPQLRHPKSLRRDGSIQLLYLSNLIESKGYLILLEACRILHYERGLVVRCEFCGSFLQTIADKAENLQMQETHFFDLIKRWGLTNIVTYHGLVKDEAKEHQLQQAHALILPTTYPWEGQPICIIEALAFSTPVIATPHRGIPEQVIDQYNGYLVEAEAKKIADAVESLCQDPKRYQLFSHRARHHFEANFTQEIYLERLISTIIGNI